jgi:CheY-like chemotaxis protein
MKVLVVEDEPLIRLGIVSLIEDAGWLTADASDADAAVELLEGEPGIGVMITDVDMPGSMDGIGLAWVVQRRWPAIRIIAISGKVSIDRSALPSGARYFSKPLVDEHLLAAIASPSAPSDTR